VEIKIDELPFKWSPKAADFINQVSITANLVASEKSLEKIGSQWN
jgi:hypothetical protein